MLLGDLPLWWRKSSVTVSAVAQMVACELQFSTPSMHGLQQNAGSDPGATSEVWVRSLETSLGRAPRVTTETLVTKSMQKPKLLMDLPELCFLL